MKIKKRILSYKFILIVLAILLSVGFSIAFSFNIGRSAELNSDGFGVENFSFNYSGDGVWEIKPQEINGAVKGSDGVGGCLASSSESTLSINYNGPEGGTVFFDYKITLNGGKCSINDSPITEDGEFKKKLGGQETIKIYIKSPESSQEAKINITNFQCIFDKEITITLLTSSFGNYYFNGNLVTSDFEVKQSSMTKFNLSNPVALEGYEFCGWLFNGTLYSTLSDFSTTYGDNVSIEPAFYPTKEAVFLNNGKLLNNLDDAIDSATASQDKDIVLLKSGSITGGNVDSIKTYNLTDGMRLIVPDQDKYELLIGDEPPKFPIRLRDGNRDTPPKLYRKLTIPSYTTINAENNSVIYVGGQGPGAVGGQYYGSNPMGQYGQMELTSDTSKIILNDTTSLYCFGFITGKGLVEAKKGSKIRELFQITDFRGGAKTMLMLSGVFPINKYYIQNIECLCRYYYGAVEEILTGFEMKGVLYTSVVSFINTTDSQAGLFRLEQNSVFEKSYDGNADRLICRIVQGNTYFSNISLAIAMTSVNSSDYVLPINNNMTIEVINDSTITIEQDLCFLPGSKIFVDENATIILKNNTSVFLYDRNSWVGKNYSSHGNDDVSPVQYAVSKTYNRSNDDLINTKLDLNGSLRLADGAGIYSTISGEEISLSTVSNVYSSKGTGRIYFDGQPGDKTSTEQKKFDGASAEKIDVIKIPLRNSLDENEIENDSYTIMDSSSDLSGKRYYFDKAEQVWKSGDIGDEDKEFTISFVDTSYGKPQYELQYINGEEFTFPSAVDTGFIHGDFQVRLWRIDGVGVFKPGETTTLSGGKSLIAYACWGGWITESGNNYYIDYYSGEFLTGLHKVEFYDNTYDELKILKFSDEDGRYENDFNGPYFNQSDGKTYFIQLGIVIEGPQLMAYQENSQLGTNLYNYLYIQEDNSLLMDGKYYIDTNDNAILPSGYYSFNKQGYIEKEDTDSSHYNQCIYILNGSTFIDGIRVAYGLFKYDGHYYYSDLNGNIVKNKTYYVSEGKLNDTGVSAGLYYFDGEGRMYDENFNLIVIEENV